jgi:hypothetical protein
LYEDLQTIIKDNKSKEPKYGTPEGCTTGILENSEELQTIIENLAGFLRLWFHLALVDPHNAQNVQILRRLTPHSV